MGGTCSAAWSFASSLSASALACRRARGDVASLGFRIQRFSKAITSPVMAFLFLEEQTMHASPFETEPGPAAESPGARRSDAEARPEMRASPKKDDPMKDPM